MEKALYDANVVAERDDTIRQRARLRAEAFRS
jgi:hypothetical protein